jgi:ketosteroid isomerase-like protein
MKVFTHLSKISVLIFCLQSFLVAPAWGQSPESDEIVHVIDQQAIAWNNADIEGFMGAYWKSDSLKFIGKKGLTYGWDQVLNNYKKSYPGKAGMGTLRFDKIEIQQLSKDYAFVTGSWNLTYTDRDALGGWFSLIFKKINGSWFIVADHSS